MKRYRLLNIRKWYVPDFVIFFKGKVHARKGLITTDDGIVKSPYLLECRYIFMEYNKKLDSMEEKNLNITKETLAKKRAEAKFLEDRLEKNIEKLSKLVNPQSGIESRRKQQLEAENSEVRGELVATEHAIEALEDSIRITHELVDQLKHEKLSRIESRSYVYLTGAQYITKTSEYLDNRDMVREVYADLLPVA